MATFTDSNPAAAATRPTVVISWGDGHQSQGTVTGPDTNGIFTVTGTNIYLPTTRSSYGVLVTISDPSGQPTVNVTSTALVSMPLPTLTPFGTTLAASPGVAFTGTVATFSDSNPAAVTTKPTAEINWGDGSQSQGTVSGPDANGVFTVTGTHTYFNASPSSGAAYAVTVTITDPSVPPPSSGPFTADSTATVGPQTLTYPFTGGLAPVGNGRYAFLGYTNTNRPTFSGQATPFSTIQLFARLSGVDATAPLGEAIAAINGNWSLDTGPLAKGFYSVTAIVTPPGGPPSGQMPLANGGGVAVGLQPHSSIPPAGPLARRLPRRPHRHPPHKPEKRG